MPINMNTCYYLTLQRAYFPNRFTSCSMLAKQFNTENFLIKKHDK
jgi:hypothetical protein